MSSGVIARYDIVSSRLISSVPVRRKLYRESQKEIAYVHSTHDLWRFIALFLSDNGRAVRSAARDGD